jgi:prepilin-type N-terminal cleavage/methylation domain-containing protein
MNKNMKQNNQGFSLIELSIIIAVFAVLLTSILAGGGIKNESENVTSVEKRMFEVEKAIAFFQKANGYLPCPASRTDAYGSATYGVSVSCAPATAAAAPAGTANIGAAGDTYQVRIGAIPTRSLGISDEAGLDPWGNRITYMIIRSLGVDSATYTAFSTAQTTDLFQIVNRSSTVTYGTTNAQIVKYVIISHGSDGRGAYNKNGLLGVACSTTAAERENCNTTKNVMQDGINDVVASSNANYYNDFVRYKPK